jgi:tryptophanyl-tRNA synthetase
MSQSEKRVVSGMRPTGKLHLGHLVGALQNWVALQEQYDSFYFVADWHALTSDYADTSGLTTYAYDNVIDWIAAGLDPQRSTFFVQSMVPEHAELYLLLSMVVPVPWLERVPTYKEQQEAMSDRDLSSIGFLGYPLLQTADVAIYDANLVPVGEDQVAHLELAREAVRRFNRFYGDVLVEPQPLLTRVARLPGLDGGKKMSKSLGNTILLSDDADSVKKKVRSMYTDPKRIRPDIPGTVEGNPVFLYHDVFNPNTAEVDELKARYRAGKVGDVEVKDKLARALNAVLEPMRERRAELASRPERIHEILLDGSARARKVAVETMARVRDAMKITYTGLRPGVQD